MRTALQSPRQGDQYSGPEYQNAFPGQYRSGQPFRSSSGKALTFLPEVAAASGDGRVFLARRIRSHAKPGLVRVDHTLTERDRLSISRIVVLEADDARWSIAFYDSALNEMYRADGSDSGGNSHVVN